MPMRHRRWIKRLKKVIALAEDGKAYAPPEDMEWLKNQLVLHEKIEEIELQLETNRLIRFTELNMDLFDCAKMDEPEDDELFD